MQPSLQNLEKIAIKDKAYNSLPKTPGVYIFWKKNTPIYVGKAINLRSRVSSYFSNQLEPKTARMVREADSIAFIKVTSELEALLLEAKLVRKNMPQYNITLKDDKHPLYIVITNEKYPRVITARKSDLKILKTRAIYGPFPSAGNIRSVLKHIRRVFPFSDHKLTKRACLYSHIGLCDPCPSEIEQISDMNKRSAERTAYLKNLKNIKAILDGRLIKVRSDLQKKMETFSKEENYESAIAIREKIKKFEYITQPQIPTENYLENPNLYEDIRRKEIKSLQSIVKRYIAGIGYLKRIECFDIAHLAGTNPTASMVTFVNGEKETRFYRHFKIYQKKGASDTDSMKEVIKRRKKHFGDWGIPNLIVVDGGKAQVGIFIRELDSTGIPVVGLAKRFETLVVPTIYYDTIKLREYRVPKGPALNLIQRIRDEAHRFARKYHHKLIAKALIS